MTLAHRPAGPNPGLGPGLGCGHGSGLGLGLGGGFQVSLLALGTEPLLLHLLSTNTQPAGVDLTSRERVKFP